MIPTLHIRLLGDFLLTSGKQPISGIDMPRLQSLLAYLMLHREAPQSRSHLAYQLWPDSTDAQAHTNLRNLIHKLRQTLPNVDAFLLIGRQTLQWRVDGLWTLDVLDFEQALAQAAFAEQNQNQRDVRQALSRTIDLYRGDLLPSCYDEWILSERDRLRQAFLKALQQLVELYEQERNYKAAISTAQRLLQYDPLHESTYRHLMQLYAVSEDRAAALHTYHICASVLERELGAEPDRATRHVYEQLLKARDPTGPLPALEPAHIDSMAAAQLVGRTREWTQLQTAWRNVVKGHPQLLLLSGEAGIGKTRLAEELLTWVNRQGMDTATARCYAAEGGLAYAPVAAWLRTGIGLTRLSKLDDIWLTEVSRLIPDLLVQRPDLPRPTPLNESWQRQHFFEALVRSTLVGGQPLLLLLDDIQWCDRETLEWVHYLLRFERQAPLLLVGTIRSEEIATDHTLANMLHSLRRNNLITEIALSPLDTDDTVSLANQIANRQLDPALIAQLYQETEGNPLFVVETVRTGVLEQHHMELPSTTFKPSYRESLLPQTVQLVIAARLAQLSLVAREVAGVAAVIGRAFTFSVLSQASGQDEDALVQGLDELWQRRIVREQGEDTYDFSHDKLREGAYITLSSVRRRLLHRRVAEALEAVHASNLDTVCKQIAAHYEQACLPQPAISYYQRAGEVAERVYANVEAMALFQKALAILQAASRDTIQQERRQEITARLNEHIGDLHELNGRHEEAMSSYQHSLFSLLPHYYLWQARLHRKIGIIWLPQRQYDAALQCFTQAEIALDLEPTKHSPVWSQEWLELQYRKITAHYWLAQVDEIAELVEKTRPVLEQHGTLALRAAFYLSIAGTNLKDGRFLATEETLQYALIALNVCEELGDLVKLGWAQYNPGFYHLCLGDLSLAEQYLLAALATAERTGEATLNLRCLTYLTIIYRRRGQVEEVRQYSLQSLAVATEGQMREYIGMAKANLAWVCLREGKVAEAQLNGRAAMELWLQTSPIYPFQWAALLPLMDIALAQDQIVEAIDNVRLLLAPQQQRLPVELAIVLEEAIQAWDNNQFEAARAHLQLATSQAKEIGYL